MVRSSTMVLSLMLVSFVLAGAQSTSPPSPVYPPTYPPSPSSTTPTVLPVQSPSPPSPAEANVTGYTRFFGPLSAGCTVNYVNVISSSMAATSLLGQVSVGPYQTVSVSPSAACFDLFTGVPIPYAVGGKSPANSAFQVSSTNTIAQASSSLAQTAAFSYANLGVKGAAQLETTEIFSAIRSGQSTAWQLLSADLQFILNSVVLANTYITAFGTTEGNNCTTVSMAQAAIAKYYAMTSSMQPSALTVAYSMLATCNVIATPVNVNKVATPEVFNALGMLSAGLPYLSRPAALDLPLFARWASLLSSLTPSALNKLAATPIAMLKAEVATALEAATIVPDQLATYLGLAGATVAQATTVNFMGVGPLSGATSTFTPFFSSKAFSLPASVANAAQTAASTANPAGTFGFYTVAAGAIDIFLTSDTTKPVTTLVPFSGAMGFTGTTATVAVSPISTFVNVTWWKNQMSVVNLTTNDLNPPSAPGPADWASAYTTILGAGVIDTAVNYMTRDFAPGSQSMAGVMVADALTTATPGLIGSFVYNSVGNNSGRPSAASINTAIVNRLIGMAAAQYTNVTLLDSVISDIYFRSGGVAPVPSVYPPPPGVYAPSYPSPAYPSPQYPPSYPPSPPPAAGRRSLQQSSSMVASNPAFDAVLMSVAKTIADSNMLLTAYITKIAAGTGLTGRRLLQNDNVFIGLSQIAPVQQQDMAAALNAIAAAIASGDLAAAQSLAAAFATNFSGANLQNLVNSKAVNTNAINSALTSGGDEEDDKRKIALGVGLGVGLGVPILAAIVAGSIICVKKRRAEQTTAPAAAAEGVHYEEEHVAVPIVPVMTEQEQIAAYYRNRLAAIQATRA